MSRLVTDPYSLAPSFIWRLSSLAVNTSQTKLVGNDASRVAIEFTVAGMAGDIFVGPDIRVANNVGYHINATPNVVLGFYFYRHGSMVGGEWWGFATGPGFFVNVTEVFWRPKLVVPCNGNGSEVVRN